MMRRVAVRITPPVVLLAGFGAMLLAWVGGNAPGGAPDERAQYIHALAAGRGELLGQPVDTATAYATTPELRISPPSILAPAQGMMRWVTIPGRLDPGDLDCTRFQPDETAACVTDNPPATHTDDLRIVTYNGTYPPFVDVVPGALMNLSSGRYSALLVGRAAFAAIGFLLLALTVWLLTAGVPAAAAPFGLIVACTPQVIFILTSVNQSSVEVASGIAMAAAALRIGRGDGRGRVWAAFGLAAVLLALSRPLGPLWIVVDVAVLVGLAGGRAVLARVREGGLAAVVALTCLCAATAVAVGWQLLAQPRYPLSASSVVHWIMASLNTLPTTVQQSIGVFGWLDTELPAAAITAWELMVAALIVLALVVGTRRQRIVVAAVVACFAVMPAVVYALATAPIANNLQGRYVLPGEVIVPLLCAEVVRLRNHAIPSLRLGALTFAAAGVSASVQALAWYVNARRYAVGADGSILFFRDPQWSPRLGWAPWMSLAIVGAALIATAGFVSRQRVDDSRTAGTYADTPSVQAGNGVSPSSLHARLSSTEYAGRRAGVG